MRMLLWILGVLLVVAIGGYGYFSYRYPTYVWNQKLTVVVETPQGEVSGASVVGVSWEMTTKILPDMPGARHKVSGEATIVALPDGRYLFALLENADFIALRAFAEQKIPVRQPTWIDEFLPAAAEVARHRDEMITLRPDSYPLLVTFTDIANPASVKKVEPGDLEATFGSGYRLQSISISITDEPVTKGAVEKPLGWLKEAGRIRSTLIPNPPRLRKDATNPDLQYLTVGSFATELYK